MTQKILQQFIFLLLVVHFPMAIAISKNWTDEFGDYKVNYLLEKKGTKGSDLSLIAIGFISDKKIWELRDLVKNCEEDPVLELIENSKKLAIDPKSGAQVYYIAYRVGCVGGIDPLNIKYFAYVGGKKNSLRGEETIICDGSSFGGEKGPVPDATLKSNPDMLKAMLKKWKKFSIRKCGSNNN